MKRTKRSTNITEFLPAFRMMLSGNELRTLRWLGKPEYLRLPELLKNTGKSKPAVSDGFIILDGKAEPAVMIKQFQKELKTFRKANKFDPSLVFLSGYGTVVNGRDPEEVNRILNELENVLGFKIRAKAKERKENQNKGKLSNRICIVTGGAQGFGEGLAEKLTEANANVIIADLNDEKGKETLQKLKKLCTNNEVAFIKTDVSDPSSVRDLIQQTVSLFGGLDLFVSNAGILKAGGLEEMDPHSFELMTKVNYQGYFICSKYAAPVMKLQSDFAKDHFSDIIQVNSKSGLRGSRNNFAYSGGKFGGIGLTQSFALELAPWRIKVNAICPGNYFEGPLWADPRNGLFIQYLKAGKVPGAKTIEDVKRYYEKQVPLSRGCSADDVFRALEYIVNQEYETGQAIPVTGGQIMLG